MLVRLDVEDAELGHSEATRFCTVVGLASVDSCGSPGASEREAFLLF